MVVQNIIYWRVTQMSKYYYDFHLGKSELGTSSVTLGYLKCLLNPLKRLESEIMNKYPISFFGKEDEVLRILGAKRFFDEYDRMDENKYDTVVKYGQIKYIGFDDKGEIVFNFSPENEDDIQAYSTYDFKTQFLDEFHMSKYVAYCLKKGYQSLIRTNIESVLTLENSKEQQFRFLTDRNNERMIRGFTSTRYYNYDNCVAIYLSFLSLHRYASQTGKSFSINRAYISDSYMHIFYEHEKCNEITGIGKVHLGIAVCNGEIKNKTFSARIRYRIMDTNGVKIFSGIYHEDLFSISHSLGIEKVEDKLNALSNLAEQENKVINFIKDIHRIDKLSEDAAHFVFTRLMRAINESKDITNQTKKKFKEKEMKDLIDNSLSLISFLSKAETISTDIDERVFVERICHKVAKELLDK